MVCRQDDRVAQKNQGEKMRWLVIVLLLPVIVWAKPVCTAGTDCYCDKVNDSGHAFYDSNLLLCEDFEAPTLVNDQGVGDGSPYYGPWYDDTGSGQVCGRGFNSYWTKNYNNGAGADLYRDGMPDPATQGCTCDWGGSSCLNGAWVGPNNLFEAPTNTGMAMLTDAYYTAEASQKPTSTATGGSGSFDGLVSFGNRMNPGLPNTQDIHGEYTFGNQRTFGITMAMAYSPNIASSDILTAPWKSNEWGWSGGPGGGDGIFTFWADTVADSLFPFDHFVLFSGFGETGSGCDSSVSAATITEGQAHCDDAFFRFQPTTDDYNQGTDWPFGSWACIRGYFENMGQSNSRFRIWITGPSYVEKKIIDISGMDTSQMAPSANGYNRFIWNSYSNNGDSQIGGTGNLVRTFRYEDNVHITTDKPVSCEQIGYKRGDVRSEFRSHVKTFRGTRLLSFL
jgi:hypothetical protein